MQATQSAMLSLNTTGLGNAIIECCSLYECGAHSAVLESCDSTEEEYVICRSAILPADVSASLVRSEKRNFPVPHWRESTRKTFRERHGCARRARIQGVGSAFLRPLIHNWRVRA